MLSVPYCPNGILLMGCVFVGLVDIFCFFAEEGKQTTIDPEKLCVEQIKKMSISSEKTRNYRIVSLYEAKIRLFISAHPVFNIVCINNVVGICHIFPCLGRCLGNCKRQ